MCVYAQREFKKQKGSYAKYIRKNKGYFFPKHELKKWFWSTKTVISSNMTYFLVRTNRALFFFKNFSNLVFQLVKYNPLAVKFLRRVFVANKMCWLSYWSMMQSLNFCRKVGKFERNQNSMHLREASVSSVSKEQTKPKNLKRSLQAKLVTRQTGYRNAAVSFRKQFRKGASMKHNRWSRHFRPSKISSQRAKFKICGEKPCLQKTFFWN